MRNSLFITFRILLAIVLAGKVLNWFLDFSDPVNNVLNIVMFSLIGIAYLVAGYIWDKQPIKTIFLLCGTFLIAMNFFASNAVLSILGIVGILLPMLMVRFSKNEESPDNSLK